MSVGYQYEDCHCHPWCSDPARDEAVRASEDGRPGPLPTLEEAIAGVPFGSFGCQKCRFTKQLLYTYRGPHLGEWRAFGACDECQKQGQR